MILLLVGGGGVAGGRSSLWMKLLLLLLELVCCDGGGHLLIVGGLLGLGTVAVLLLLLVVSVAYDCGRGHSLLGTTTARPTAAATLVQQISGGRNGRRHHRGRQRAHDLRTPGLQQLVVVTFVVLGMRVVMLVVVVVHNRGRGRRRGRIGARIQQVQLLAREDILVVLPFPASHQFFSNALQSTFHLRGFSRRLFPPGHMHSAGTASYGMTAAASSATVSVSG